MSWTAPRTWVTGEVVTAAEMNTHVRDNLSAVFPASATYSTYTPALTASTTNPTLGSGSTATGRYLQIGSKVHYHGAIIFGTGSASGSGTYQVSLPLTMSSSVAANVPIGMTSLFDSDTSAWASIAALATASSAHFTMIYAATWPSGAITEVTQGTPWSWADSDAIYWSIVYEAA